MSSTIKVPRRSPKSRVETALAKAPKDGQFHVIVPSMGMTSAEQTARAYNVPGCRWELGYDYAKNTDGIFSVLYARWIGEED